MEGIGRSKRKAEDDVVILLKIIVIVIKHASNNVNGKLHISAATHPRLSLLRPACSSEERSVFRGHCRDCF